jgi:hypothetical protein
LKLEWPILPTADFRTNGTTTLRRVTVELRRLHDDNKRDCVLVLANIPVHIELGHQRAEYSSANEPISALKSFQIAIAASSAFASAKRCLCSCATKSERSDSTTPDLVIGHALGLLHQVLVQCQIDRALPRIHFVNVADTEENRRRRGNRHLCSVPAAAS